jgi:predicted Zn-dependent protease
MRRAVAHHRKPDAKAARSAIDALAQKRPDDPFIHELRGQILLESRDLGGAVNAYARAANLAPRNALILAGYGRALLAAKQKGALDVLRRARDLDPRSPRLLRDLAQANAAAGQNGQASLATAERYALLGRLKDAEIHATRATGLLPRGSPGWRRADDILAAAKRQK